MPVTLTRRLRRIGLMPSTYVEHTNGKHTHIQRIHNFDPNLTPEERADLEMSIRAKHAFRQDTAKPPQKSAKHRRSKSRRATQKKAA